ncbi:MAG: transcriptional repressor LexA [Clostridiales Family XIII bacterium]|jgi:repressor LexA|nr:transcriptional repressor LexA [Clostridiales Family XIII bacterium]
MEALKPRERKILDLIKKKTKKQGYPPTVREICAALDIKSTSTVHKDIERLHQKNYLKKDPSKPRALMITDKSAPSKESGGIERLDVVDIPVVGRVAAGTPILAVTNVEETIPIPERYVKGTNFMLKIHGDSMIEVGIFDGDLVLVRKQNTANNGDIVVAMVDGFESEATVKTFFKEDGHIRLQPENSGMSPIIVNDVTILGLVKGVFRYYN